jgi:hypothetical protein
VTEQAYPRAIPAGIRDSRGAGYPGQLIGLQAPEPVEKMRQNRDETGGVRTAINRTTPRVLPGYPDPHIPGSNSSWADRDKETGDGSVT